ncbi:MAG: hypothetical protein HY063_01410 [Bacteroidetes bacterium]|nr:hypothetical protein [Bacteroidota bacterium]
MNYKPKSLPAQKALLEKQKMLRKKNKMKTLARGGQLRTGRQLLDNVIITLQDEKEIYDLSFNKMLRTVDSDGRTEPLLLTAGVRNAGLLFEKMFSVFNYICSRGQPSAF